MMQFDFNWSEPLNLIVLALAVAMLPMQVWMVLFKNKTDYFTSRQWVRLGLNVLLWLAVMALIVQPFIVGKSKNLTGVLVGKDVPVSKANSLKDSLVALNKTLTSAIGEAAFDTLILAGQDFDNEAFAGIMRAEAMPAIIQWIPFYADVQLQKLRWKGIVQTGEMQIVRGAVNVAEKQLIKLTYGSETLDSAILKPGFNEFELQFPAFVEGRTIVKLSMNRQMEETIHFFARPLEKLTFQFILDNPDFESRNLANWLGKAGHSVIYTTTLSKNLTSQQTINKAKEPDVIITDVSNVNNTLVKKGLSNGKSVLFMNLTEPAAQIKAINAALGTHLEVKRIATDEFISVTKGLTAMPYRFSGSNRYLISQEYPVAVEKIQGKVGVTLLNETFPLQLTGDSAVYQKVWDAVLSQIKPASNGNFEVQSPLFEDVKSEIVLNNFNRIPPFLNIGSDTLYTDISPLNEKSAKLHFKPTETGWIKSMDSSHIDFYIEKAKTGNLYNTARLRDFVKSYHKLQKETQTRPGEGKGEKREFPDWMWFALIIGCLLAVWIERKL